MNDAVLFSNAVKLKGYGSFDKNEKKTVVERKRKVSNDLVVKPTVVTSVGEYLEFIQSLESTYENPVFYRGQGNANYLINPGVFRNNLANEDKILEAFRRHFPSEVDSCPNDMARLVLMQHFGLSTRALDISENPLASLYFACSPMKKFCVNREQEMAHWGEVVIFRELAAYDDDSAADLKSIRNSSVSVMASTAFMGKTFSLWKLGMEWKKDNNYMREERYIPLKEIIHCSRIVRVPQNNPRIKNQQGAFIMINANRVTGIAGSEDKALELTKLILSDKDLTFNYLMKQPKWNKCFEDGNTWELEFEKVTPYSGSNEISIFDTDPFDLHRLFYTDKDDVQQVVLIPPDKKEDIIKELGRLNITEDFIYPDMDNVAHEIVEQYSKIR